jgi:cysteine desulfurase
MPARSVYLDYNATTPLHPEVAAAMRETMAVSGNPSSMHEAGRQARALVEEAREKVAGFIGAQPEEIMFTGSGSEANNTVLSILACPSTQCHTDFISPDIRRGRKIVTSTIEHPCILETAKCMTGRGAQVEWINTDEYGIIRMDELEDRTGQATGLVSIMMANNEIGTIQDIRAIAEKTHEKGALFHTDAVQAAGKVPVDVKDLGADFLTLSAHKIYGPKGIGALYVRKGVPFCPLIRGGHQEKGRRAGTENTLGIVGFGKAVEMREKEMTDEAIRLAGFKKKLRAGITAKIPDINFNGHPEKSLPGTLNVSFEGAEGEAILLYLDLEGIMVSTGSACASGSLDPSHVLLATGMPVERAHGSIRISMGRETSEEDIAYVLEKLPEVIRKIREMSTIYGGRVTA